MIDVEQLLADMEAGTGGPWYAIMIHPENACIEVFHDGRGICTIYSAPDEYSRKLGDGKWSTQPIRDNNARRIARLPDLEQAYLDLHKQHNGLAVINMQVTAERDALHEQNRKLREALGAMVDNCYSHDEDSTEAFGLARAALAEGGEG